MSSVPDTMSDGKVIPYDQTSNQRSSNSKNYGFTLPLILGISGLSLMKISCWHADLQSRKFTLSLFAIGCSFATISLILGVDKLITIIFDLKDTPATKLLSKIGGSPLGGNRPDPKTISGACKVLGISEDKSNDMEEIDKQKTATLSDLQKTLNRLRSVNKVSQPLVSAMELKIEEVKQAYETLIECFDEK